MLLDGQREQIRFVAARHDERMTWRKWKRIEEGGSGFAFGEEIAFAEPMAEGTRGFWFIHGRSISPRLLPNTAEEAE